MRLCPSVEGSASPLITHRIGSDVCMARQRTFFHKCHRCIYRGQAADWKPPEELTAMLNLRAAEEPARVGVVEIDLSVPRGKAARGRGKSSGQAKGQGAKRGAAKPAPVEVQPAQAPA